MVKKYLLLVVLIIFSIGLVKALDTEEVKIANFLAQEGIIKDYSVSPEDYKLGSSITRRETMKIIMKLSGLEIEEKCEGEFPDVKKDGWACKYIESGLKYGFIAKNPTFNPSSNITKTECMKMVLKAKSIEKVQVTEDWKKDYMETAYEYGIIDEKYSDYNSQATRGWLFKIATATIEKEEEIKEKQNKIYTDEPSI